MPNYANGKVYSLRSYSHPELIYIGSTTQTLSKRKRDHLKDYNRYLQGKINYMTSFELIQYDDCYIELIENCECKCKEELLRREGQIIREYDCVNKQIAGRTKQEYRQENKDNIIKYGKEYYKKNSEIIKEKKKNYYHINKEKLNKKVECECGSFVNKQNLSRHCKSKKHQSYINNL